MNFKRKASFENAFKKDVTNFDETRIWFEHKSRMNDESNVCFITDGKLQRLPMYKSQYEIDKWKQHFIEFLDTGIFEMQAYWQVYGDEVPNEVKEKIWKFPLTKSYGNYFHEHSEEFSNWLTEIKKDNPWDCGVRQITKPIDKEIEN